MEEDPAASGHHQEEEDAATTAPYPADAHNDAHTEQGGDSEHSKPQSDTGLVRHEAQAVSSQKEELPATDSTPTDATVPESSEIAPDTGTSSAEAGSHTTGLAGAPAPDPATGQVQQVRGLAAGTTLPASTVDPPISRFVAPSSYLRPRPTVNRSAMAAAPEPAVAPSPASTAMPVHDKDEIQGLVRAFSFPSSDTRPIRHPPPPLSTAYLFVRTFAGSGR